MEMKQYLEDLERRIDCEAEDALTAKWLEFANGNCKEPFFAPSRKPSTPSIEWEHAFINDALFDLDAMVYSQLKMCSDTLASGSGAMMSVRGNYGTGIIPSMFGAEAFIMPREQNILPGSWSLKDGEAGIRRIVEENVIDFSKGFAKNVFEFGELFCEYTKNYPNITKYVHMSNPDLQGPLPLIESMWGSDVYYAFYDDPDLIDDSLKFISDVYISFTKKWQDMYPAFDAEHSIEWGLLHKGMTILRNDAAMNLSADMYEEFVAKHDARVFAALGGGVHFCGRGEHYLPIITKMDGVYCVNMSQPEYNDMEAIYRCTVDQGLTIIGMSAEETLRANAVRPLRGKVHSGISAAAFADRKPEVDK